MILLACVLATIAKQSGYSSVTGGGPRDFVDAVEKHLPRAPVVQPVKPPWAGTVSSVDVRALGIAVVELGGGRRKADDQIDHAVGFTDLAPVAAAVGAEAPLAIVHARTAADGERAAAAVRAAYQVGDDAVLAPPLFYDRIGESR